MATDATGTPSTLGIPKYNTSADSPSGKGLNAIVDSIDTLIAARIAKTLTTTTGDIIYASSANTPARLGVGSTGQVLTVAGGIPAWASSAGSADLDYVQITGDVSVTATTSAGANTIVTGTSQAYDGTPIWVEFVTAGLVTGTTSIILVLYDGATQLGRIANVTSGAGYYIPAHTRVKITPSVATHQYIIKGYVDGGSGGVVAGSGASGTNYPSFIRVSKV